MKKDLLAILGLCFIGFLLLLPALGQGPLIGHDTEEHLNWVKYFSAQVWAGEGYPRWLQGMNYGLGSPSFFYYPPVPYWITSAFYRIRGGLSEAWSQMLASAYVGLVVSGMTAYLWLKQFTARQGAICGAIVYMAFPYHVAVDFYWRVAFAEYWAFAWMPLILYFTHRLARDQRFATAGFALSYALLVMTHLPTTLLFSPLALAYLLFGQRAAIQADHSQEKQIQPAKKGWVVRAITAQGLGIGLAAVYLLPALATQDTVSFKRMFENERYFANNFLGSSLFAFNDFRSYLSLLAALLLLLGVVFSHRCLDPHKIAPLVNRRQALFWRVALLVSVLMSTTFSYALWQVFSVLEKVQFPWRFLTVSTLCVAAISALMAQSIDLQTLSVHRLKHRFNNLSIRRSKHLMRSLSVALLACLL
jgi:hypothetical protein